MLNLHVAMKSSRYLFLCLLFIVFFGYGMRPPTKAKIDSPRSGDILQGVVSIIGSSTEIGFQSFEVSFSYEEGDLESWFLLNQGQEAITNDILATWDTTTIADGKYKVRVQVFLDDGSVTQSMVTGLQVRNYSSVDQVADPLSQETVITVTPEETPVLAKNFYPGSTVTPLPINPVEVRPRDLQNSLMMGIMFTGFCFVLYGLYQIFRGFFFRNK